jgi:hypothetical protein
MLPFVTDFDSGEAVDEAVDETELLESRGDEIVLFSWGSRHGRPCGK